MIGSRVGTRNSTKASDEINIIMMNCPAKRANVILGATISGSKDIRCRRRTAAKKVQKINDRTEVIDVIDMIEKGTLPIK